MLRRNLQFVAPFLALTFLLTLTLTGAPRDGGYSRHEARKKYQRPAVTPEPAGNRGTPERVLLGKSLFFDPRISGSGWISCASCHNPALGWSDGLPRAIGHGMKTLGRRTPTILNLAEAELLFWDGRAGSLEEQALGPIAAAGEMNMPLPQLVATVRSIRGYEPLFGAAYPGEAIDKETIGKAIAAFERTIVSGPAPFDAWVNGDERAISEQAKRGFDLFNTRANCSKCHSGWAFTDSGFHDIGLASEDKGRGVHLPLEAMQHAFKTPTLRNVARAPYMHDGSERTLEDVIELYDRGGRVKRPSLSPEIVPLNLTAEEKRDLTEFLLTLSGKDPEVAIPALPNKEKN